MITLISKSSGPKFQRCYNGVRLLPERMGLFPKNVYKIDAGAMPMIKRMAQRGLEIDLSHFATMGVTLGRDMERVTEEIYTLSGYHINPGSGDQVADLLFKKMGLKQAKIKFTDSGSRESVEDEVLTAIQHEHPVVGKCLEYKEYEKLKGTYVDPMPKLARKVDGVWRMFPNFRNTKVPSGRLSCVDPNLLAMPSRTERGRQVRCGFPAAKGYKKVSVDLSQIEPRWAAHRSRDTNLCNVYINQEDIYSDFATSAFKIPDKRYRDSEGWHYPGVDKMDHRRPAKTCVLASIYDVTAAGLQEQMPVICAGCNRPAVCGKCDEGKNHRVPEDCFAHNCDKFRPLWIENKCQGIINAFYMRYSELLKMRMEDHRYMRRTATMCDSWGRGQHITAARSVLEWVVMGALREGSNLPMQGGAQGVIKLAMAAIDDDFVMSGLYGDICNPELQIHDELLFEVRDEYVEEVTAMMVYRMENVCRLNEGVPLVASGVKADTWGDLPK